MSNTAIMHSSPRKMQMDALLNSPDPHASFQRQMWAEASSAHATMPPAPQAYYPAYAQSPSSSMPLPGPTQYYNRQPQFMQHQRHPRPPQNYPPPRVVPNLNPYPTVQPSYDQTRSPAQLLPASPPPPYAPEAPAPPFQHLRDPMPQDISRPIANPHRYQSSERASIRISAQKSLSEHYYDSDESYRTPSSSSRKRSHSNDDFSDVPKPKQKKRATGPGPYKGKRGDQLEARNARSLVSPVSETDPSQGTKGDESYHSAPTRDAKPPPTLSAELQSARCMSSKYRSEIVSKCLSCTRRGVGDICRFQGIRLILRDDAKVIIGVAFTQSPDTSITTNVTFPDQWNKPFSDEHKLITKRMAARTLLPLLKREIQHVYPLKDTIFRPRETDCRATCDTCMTSTFSETWMCRTCGREACGDCFRRIEGMTMIRRDATEEELAQYQLARARFLAKNPTFLACHKKRDHDSACFNKVTRFKLSELEQTIAAMEVVLSDEAAEGEAAIAALGKVESNSDCCNTASSGISSPRDSIGFDSPLSSCSSLSPDTSFTSPFSEEVPCYAIPRYEPDLAFPEFQALWKAGQPILISGMLDRLKIKWTPEYFIQEHGDTEVRVLDCQSDTDPGRMVVAKFFSMFGHYETREVNKALKLRDWPPSADFKTVFPALYEDFSQAVPFPDYVRRDGVLNMSSHFPTDVLAPDLGPKMYNALATHTGTGSQGSTKLHMDMADALNIMTYASQKPDGSPGCAAWDLFKREDSDLLRRFLKEDIAFNSEFSDGIHSQIYYLTEDLRRKLFEKYGVKSYRVYQRPGEAIMIPAGCAHQVANLADCIKVAVDYVSPENIQACEKLTEEFRRQNIKAAWKEDVLQLRSMMWWAWRSCTRMGATEAETSA